MILIVDYWWVFLIVFLLCLAGGLWFWGVSRYQAHREADALALRRRHLATRPPDHITMPPPADPPRRGDHS